MLYLSFRVQGLRGGAERTATSSKNQESGPSSRNDRRATAKYYKPIHTGKEDKEEADGQQEEVNEPSTSTVRDKSKARRRGLRSLALGSQSFSTAQVPTSPVVATSPPMPPAPRIDVGRHVPELSANKTIIEGGKQDVSMVPLGPPPPPPNPQRHRLEPRPTPVTGTHLTVPSLTLPAPPTSRRIGLPSSPRATLAKYREDQEKQLQMAGSGGTTAEPAIVSPTRSERQMAMGRKPPPAGDPMGLDDVHAHVTGGNGGPAASTRIPSPVKRNRSPRSVSNLPVPPTSRTFWKQSKRSASEAVSGRKVHKDVTYDDDEAML